MCSHVYVGRHTPTLWRNLLPVFCSENEASWYLSTLLHVILSQNSAFFMVLHTFQFFYVPLVLQVFVFFLYILSNKPSLLNSWFYIHEVFVLGPVILKSQLYVELWLYCVEHISGDMKIFCCDTVGILVLIYLQIEEKGLDAVNVREVLLEMRRFRMGLIQTPDQLRFSYWAIIEGSNKYLNGSNLVSKVIISQ